MTDTVEETIKMQPLQELLVQAREKKNMTLGEAAKKLNLKVGQIGVMQEQLDRLPKDFYEKYFTVHQED